LRCGSLDVFEALAEELRIAAVQADVVLRGTSRFQSDCAANDKGYGLGFCFANAWPNRSFALGASLRGYFFESLSLM